MTRADVADTFECICAALAEGSEAVVEVTRHDDGRLSIEWGVADLPLMTTDARGARATAAQMLATDWQPEIGRMLITAADFCDRGGAELN